MLDKCRETKTLACVELAKKNLVEWHGKGMKLNGATDMDIKFRTHVIVDNIYTAQNL